MATPILREPVRDASAWTRADLAGDDSWKTVLRPEDLADIDRALARVEAAGLRWGDFAKDDFALPTFGPRLADIDRQLRHGRGFALIRGFPVSKDTTEQIRTIYWGLGVHLGQVISHNTKGDFIAPVTDLGLKDDDPNRRNNTTNRPLDPHTDLADVVTLLCIEKAREGGMSSLASSAAIHNEILAHHPEYLETLYEGFHHDFRGYGFTGDPNEVTPTKIPVFEWNAGRISCAFVRKLIETGAAKRGVPLTPLEQAAMDCVHELGLRDDLRIDMMLEPGDIQLINNYATLHSRTDYVDHDDGRKRYLLRMWINLPDHVQLSRDFATFVRRGIPAGRVAA